MPFHGDVRDFGLVVIGAGPAGMTAAELDGVLGYSVALVERDIDDGADVSRGGGLGKPFRQATLERIRERGLHLIHGERCLVASRSEGTCSSLAWFSSVWRSRSIHFR